MKKYSDHKSKNEHSVNEALKKATDNKGRFVAYMMQMIQNGNSNLADLNDASAEELKAYLHDNLNHIATTLPVVTEAIFSDKK